VRDLGTEKGTRSEDTNLPSELGPSAIPHVIDPNAASIVDPKDAYSLAERMYPG